MDIDTDRTECAFEPDIVEVHCIDCGKPTGIRGTCRDVDLCAACRDSYATVIPEAEISQMMIAIIERTSSEED